MALDFIHDYTYRITIAERKMNLKIWKAREQYKKELQKANEQLARGYLK